MNINQKFKEKIKILHITPVWTGLQTQNISGMPAFYNYFLYNKKLKIENNVWFIENLRKFKLKQKGNFILKKKLSLLNFVLDLIKNKYDCIYFHGSATILYLFISKFFKIKIITRIYGCGNNYNEIKKKGKFKFFISHPATYLFIKINSNLKVVTDDGSNGYRLVKFINRSSKIFFEKNGYNKIKFKNINKNKKNKLITYISRVSEKKNQIMFVKFAQRIIKKDKKFKFIFYGQISDNKYHQKVLNYIKEKKITQNINYGGVLSNRDILKVIQKSFMCVYFQRYSNFSNSLIEAISLGTPILSLNDKNLKKYFYNFKNIYQCKNLKEAVDTFIKIKNKKIKVKNTNTIKNVMMTWQERIAKEIHLVRKVINES